jgi:hypothetical protein
MADTFRSAASSEGILLVIAISLFGNRVGIPSLTRPEPDSPSATDCRQPTAQCFPESIDRDASPANSLHQKHRVR